MPLFLGLALFLLVLVSLNLRMGAFDTGWLQIPGLLWRDDETSAAFALREIRLPRVFCAVLVGAALAVSGLLIQIVTRNPLGDPGLTGVTGGASFGVALAITLLSPGAWSILGCGIIGGAVAASLTFLLSHHAGMRSLHLLLAGIAVSIFFLGATGAVMIAERSSMQALYFWMVGGFAGKGWVEVSVVAPPVLTGMAISATLAPVLSVLALDDRMARGLGLAVGRWRLAAAALSVLLAASAVAVAGPIAFVGFVAPHLMRRVGLDGGGPVPIRMLLPLSALTGACLTTAADLAARTPALGGNAPAGIWVTVLGGLLFLLLSRGLIQEVTG